MNYPQSSLTQKLFLLIFGFTFLFVSPFLRAQSESVSSAWIDHNFKVMGTEARIRFWHENPEVGSNALKEVVSEMHRIDAEMSPFKETSLLSKVNRLAATEAVILTPELFAVIQQSLEISALTDGAFDISFSSIGYLYDYRKQQQPDSKQLKKQLPLINYKRIQLDQEQLSIRFLDKGMRIDLGGIAKGLAVDNSISILKKHGIKEALVTAGGDTFALGNNGGKLWKVGIKHPRAQSKVVTLLPVANEAVSTSGDYERFFLDGDERVHHIINPKTGKSALQVQSVTIIAENSTLADALSTSVFVLGVEDGLTLVEALENVSVIIVDNKGKLFYSSDLVSTE